MRTFPPEITKNVSIATGYVIKLLFQSRKLEEQTSVVPDMTAFYEKTSSILIRTIILWEIDFFPMKMTRKSKKKKKKIKYYK